MCLRMLGYEKIIEDTISSSVDLRPVLEKVKDL
ncbi:hypothetical protein OKW21_003047 [Catalinimonas alkaloidigena]|nr:hypothetical protein [Catalinimonas alkaloidigena]